MFEGICGDGILVYILSVGELIVTFTGWIGVNEEGLTEEYWMFGYEGV